MDLHGGHAFTVEPIGWVRNGVDPGQVQQDWEELESELVVERRPNPIGVTVVRLLGRQGNTLRVRGLDAYDGPPVLDLKPYLRRGDMVSDATAASWILALWEGDGR